MPYSKASELPDSVKHVLPSHAQHIYMKSFNSAWDEYKESRAVKTIRLEKKQLLVLHGQR